MTNCCTRSTCCNEHTSCSAVTCCTPATVTTVTAQFQAHMLHRLNPSGNKGNPHNLDKVLTCQLSLSFQQQRHSLMLYPTHQKTRSPNQMVDKDRGHIPAKCPTKNKGNQQWDKKHKNGDQQIDKRCKNLKQTQDQPQFSNPNNRCLHCAGNHGSCDCPMRHQHHAPPTNNPVGSTSINSQHPPHFLQPSLPQHSQQSQSTEGSSTPMLMINNPQQFQHGHQRQTTAPVQQQVNQRVRPPAS